MKRSTVRSDAPFSIDELVRLPYECPKAEQPEVTRSFAGLNGITFEAETTALRQVGFTAVEHARKSAWILSASQSYRLGLPVLERDVVTRSRSTRRKHSRGPVEPAHHPWNARSYAPVISPVVHETLRSSRGRRVYPTAEIDTLIFNVDDRRPYFPNAYPWTCIGRLESETGAPMGSAALVGRDLVLTARHCVPDRDSFFMKFVPAFHDGRSTLGPSVFSWVKHATHFEGREAGAWDFALLRLYQPLGDHVGFFGVRTYDDDWDDLNVWAAAGYPSMSPFNSQRPSFLLGVAVDDADEDGDATELESENQDNSRGASGGPLWAVWPNGPYIVGVTSANEGVDYGPFGTDYQVLNASGKAMVEMVAMARLEIELGIHINPPKFDLIGG